MEDNITAIIVAILSGAIPGFFALRQSHRTKKSVELAGSEVTVQNWNKLINNLYGEIERLNTQIEVERKRAVARESALLKEIEDTKRKAEAEKLQLLAEIKALKDNILQLERRVTAKLGIDDTQNDNPTN